MPRHHAAPDIPTGGTTGQALVKSSAADYATTWSTVVGPVGPTGPTGPQGPTIVPVPSIAIGFGGMYVPKRGLDIWNKRSNKTLRNIVCLGDSLTDAGEKGGIGTDDIVPATNTMSTTANSTTVTFTGTSFDAADVGSAFWGTNIPSDTHIVSVNSATSLTLSNAATGTTTTGSWRNAKEGFVKRVRNWLANTATAHYGFVPPYKGDFHSLYVDGSSYPEITSTHSISAWTQVTATSTSDFMPFTGAFLTPSIAGVNTAKVGTNLNTTNGSATVTVSAGSVFDATDVGKLFFGTNIPGNTKILTYNGIQSVTLTNAATGTTGAGSYRVEGPYAMWQKPDEVTCASFDIVWIDDSNSSGSFSYSTNGGSTWTNVAQSAPATPILKRTTVNTTPTAAGGKTSIIVRAYNATGAPGVMGTGGRFTFGGFQIFSTTTRIGYAVHNLGYSGNTLRTAIREAYTATVTTTSGSTVCTAPAGTFKTWPSYKHIKSSRIPAGTTYTYVSDTQVTLSAAATSSGTSTATIGSQGDPYAWLDNSGTGWQGVKPDILIVGFLNDKTLFADPSRYTDTLGYLKSRIGGYCDLLVWEPYEPIKTPDWRDLTSVVTNGTTTVTCAGGAFTAGDVGTAISGTNIPDNDANAGPVTITAVNSSTNITISTSATGSSSSGTLTLGSSPTNLANYRAAIKTWCNDNQVAYLDLYDAFDAEGLTGGAAINSEGYLNIVEKVHPSQKGYTNWGARLVRLLNWYT